IWVGTERGVAVLQQGRPLSLNLAEPLKENIISALCSDRKGTVWIGVKGMGVFEVAGDKLVLLNGPDQDALRDPHCLLEEPSGRRGGWRAAWSRRCWWAGEESFGWGPIRGCIGCGASDCSLWVKMKGWALASCRVWRKLRRASCGP